MMAEVAGALTGLLMLALGCPMYYTITRSATTNGSGNTCSNHFRFLTAANQQNCVVVQLGAQVRNSTTAGSGFMSVAVYAQGTTAGGHAHTPPTRHPSVPPAAPVPRPA